MINMISPNHHIFFKPLYPHHIPIWRFPWSQRRSQQRKIASIDWSVSSRRAPKPAATAARVPWPRICGEKDRFAAETWCFDMAQPWKMLVLPWKKGFRFNKHGKKCLRIGNDDLLSGFWLLFMFDPIGMICFLPMTSWNQAFFLRVLKLELPWIGIPWALEQFFGDPLDPFRFCWLHHFWEQHGTVV